MSHKKSFVKKGQFYRSLVATALIANGVFQLVAPVLAEGTAANQTISNTGTATYQDEQGNVINATSNTVTVTVAEVAGITVVGAGPVFKTDANSDGNFNARDEFYFVYDVQNVGNDPTKFQIPGAPTVVGPGTLNGQVEISYNGTDWTAVDATAGLSTNSVAPGGIVKVRVPVKVNDNAPTNGKISVELGNTDPDAQNQPRIVNPDDVYTVDNADGQPGEVAGPPVNGVREASTTQEITVDSSLTTYALARVLKTNSNYASAGAIGPVGDTLDYNLSLEVLNTDPTGNNISPVALEGKVVPGLTGNNILVSDAIPEGTKLKSVNAPAGWTAVYSIGAVATDANLATWTTVAPSDLATVKRVGFVKTGTVNPGTTIPGFKITVEVTSTENSVTVANVAQLFGKTPSGQDVYDESGDAQPSNYDEVNQLFPNTTVKGDVPTTIPDTAIDDGYVTAAELANYGTDTNNDNTGTGAGGEANVYTIGAVGVSSILNGPNGVPDANVGGDNNIDFTNKSATVPAGIKPGDATNPATVTNPGVVSFTNTIKNTGNSRADIVLAPQAPVIPGDLPNGTKVTLTYNNGTPVVYTYNAGTFTLNSGTAIKILQVASNDTRNYIVDVELPANSPLSTDTGKGSPVAIRAFVDNDNNGVADKVTVNGVEVDAQNVTINRVYLGYLKLVKTSRVLKGTDPETVDENTFSIAPKSPRPGNIIEYKIEYQNISEVAGGPGNVILNAKKIEIVEDGTLSTTPGDGKNNWAKDNDGDGEIDTINVPTTAVAATATITYEPSGDNESVTKYIVKSEVAPQVTKTFTFQRRVNSVSPTGTAKNTP
ncbi:hypothetical protein [Rivularia sp. UHCC 0363]|uniref:DUF7925 domain-containing protein n=1 Tax=Rivularia sp. UHCC 0363 TaxID=3110244 RepID=UPI002B1F5547|nr:hypothetical protein [Rivularia sp. UHCC 0363]MEA5598742.1 hypothetical protein [Rivularia sp. UHCC 0363]